MKVKDNYVGGGNVGNRNKLAYFVKNVIDGFATKKLQFKYKIYSYSPMKLCC